MGVVYIGCELSNQCRNYKSMCGFCSDNYELDNRVDLESFADDCNIDDDEE